LAADDNKRAAPPSAKSPRTPRAGSKGKGEGSVGNALRSVYQQTVNEEVPSEFLDLLGKLK
jgi:hypothetical protein